MPAAALWRWWRPGGTAPYGRPQLGQVQGSLPCIALSVTVHSNHTLCARTAAACVCCFHCNLGATRPPHPALPATCGRRAPLPRHLRLDGSIQWWKLRQSSGNGHYMVQHCQGSPRWLPSTPDKAAGGWQQARLGGRRQAASAWPGRWHACRLSTVSCCIPTVFSS